MINDFLEWDMSNLTLQQIEQLHAIKQMAQKRICKLYIQKIKSEETAEMLRGVK